MEAERRFRAMGTDVHVVVHGRPELADLARSEIERLDARWSRFRRDSEVTAVNERAGDWVDVSPETALLFARAIDGWRTTGGHFDPTVLGDVIRAGYDRSFDALVDRAAAPVSHLRRGAGGVAVDLAEPAVRIAAGTGFDPGGMGKGLAADLVAGRVSDEGAAGVLVNVGGDLRALGCGPAGQDWTVDIDPAATGRPLATVALDHGALATSTVLRRRWRIDGRPRHHLIDPTTGEPADRGVVAATVLAAEGWQAEVLAKAALIAGLETGLALVHQLGGAGIVVDGAGTLHRSPGFDRFVVAARPPAPSHRG